MSGRFGDLLRNSVILLCLGTVFPAWASFSSSDSTDGGKADEKKANEIEAQKLNRLVNLLDLREAKYAPGSPAGTVDRDSGNPTQATTAMHDYTRSICMSWINPQSCDRWLDPYVPLHGQQAGGDASQLEGLVASEWQQRETVDSGNQYKIWEIRRLGGGSNVDSDGKLDLSGVVQWSLLPSVQNKVKDLGTQAGARVMLASYDKYSTPGQNVMPDRMSLNVSAQVLTKQMRNRFGRNLGSSLAADPGSEFLLSEDVPDCETYMAAEQALNRGNQLEEKLPYQANLSPQTSAMSLQQRYMNCKASRQARFDSVNPQVANGKLGGGDPEGEPIDRTLNRLNIAAIDRAGVNVASLPRPSNVALTADQMTSEFSEFQKGGLSVKAPRRDTNAATLNAYNNNLEVAAQSMKNVALRLPGFQTNEDQIRSFKIQPGTKSAIEINGLTPDMKSELSSTSFSKAPSMQPAQAVVENTASELTITKH